MGEAQWFQPTVRNRLVQAIILANFTINYGKFYDINNPYNEVASAQGTKINSKDEFEFGHCGRASSPTGTDGTFEIHIDGTGETIAEIHWDCPWSGSNVITTKYVKEGYNIAIEGFNTSTGGALGKGTISVLAD